MTHPNVARAQMGLPEPPEPQYGLRVQNGEYQADLRGGGTLSAPVQQATPEQFLRMLAEYQRHRPAGADTSELTDEEREGARGAFQSGRACVHCGGLHLRACPRVKRFVFDEQRRVREVEFWADGEWPADVVVWPEDVAEPADSPADSG